MIINIVSNVSLPIRTGPSFTAIERANYFKNKHRVNLWYPYLNPNHQLEVWGKTIPIESYKGYLKQKLNIDKSINIFLYNTDYDNLYKWQTTSDYEFNRIFNNNKSIYILEDCVSLLSFSKDRINKLNNFKIFFINHTNYFDIMPKIYKNVFKKFFNYLFSNSQIYHLSYNKSIMSHLKFKNIDVLPIHGINKKFFTNQLPNASKIYMMGKIDESHKNILEAFNWTQGIVESIDYFGVGKDEYLINQYDHIKKMNIISDHVKALKDYKILIHSSYKEGICSVIAEALAMNKFVIIRDTECNQIFKNNSNAYFYKDQEEFKNQIKKLIDLPPKCENNKDIFKWENANKLLHCYIRSRLEDC